MKTIETMVTVDESGQFTIQVPDDVMPGRHHVVLVIDEGTKGEAAIATHEIDAAFAEMAHDSEYQTEALQLEAEFAVAQWEALQISEAQQ